MLLAGVEPKTFRLLFCLVAKWSSVNLAQSTTWRHFPVQNWNLEVLVLRRGENQSTWRKPSQSKEEEPTTITLNPQMMLSQAWATFVGGECSRHCAIPRAIRLWNNLPQEAVNCPSTDSFRNAVSKCPVA